MHRGKPPHCFQRGALAALGLPPGAEPQHSGQIRLEEDLGKGGQGGISSCDLSTGYSEGGPAVVAGRLQPLWVKRLPWLGSRKQRTLCSHSKVL